MIPKILFQVSENVLHPLIVGKVMSQAKGWKYVHFDNNRILKFFDENPIPGLENISEVFNSIKGGSHKADLFRYYFLYIVGGLYIDSDLMIYENADFICKNADFVTCNSSYCPNSLFQGMIGASPGNIVIFNALKNLYDVDKDFLDLNYFWVVTNLYQVFHEVNKNFKFILYEEKYNDQISAKVVDENDDLIAVHYYKHKKIPLFALHSRQNKFKLYNKTSITPIKFKLF